MTLRAFGCWFVLLIISVACGNRTEETTSTPTETTISAEDSVLRKLNIAVARNPRDAEAYHERAMYWQGKEDVNKALADMKSALLLDTTNANFFYTLGELYFKIGAFDEADEVLGIAIKRNPKLAKAYVKRGEFAFYQKKYNTAIAYLNDGLRQDINFADGYFWKGMVYREQNVNDKAISGFLTAIEQNPDHHEAYMQLGLLYNEQKDKRAHQYFTNALRTDSQSKEAWYARGMYLQEQGFADSARQDYRSLLKIDSSHANANFNMGYLSMMDKDYSEAIQWYGRAFGADPQYYAALYNRGLCYELLGDKTSAAADFRRTLTIEPGYDLAVSALKRLK